MLIPFHVDRVPQTVADLVRCGVSVHEVRPIRPSIESLFFSLTNQSVEL